MSIDIFMLGKLWRGLINLASLKNTTKPSKKHCGNWVNTQILMKLIASWVRTGHGHNAANVEDFKIKVLSLMSYATISRPCCVLIA